MAINISNIGDVWTVKLYKESWYFRNSTEFSPVFDFFMRNNLSFCCSIIDTGFSVSMSDVNLKSCTYVQLDGLLKECLDFKRMFGDKNRLGELL